MTKLEQHESQTSFSKGYGGKYGVQQNTDKSALGYDADTKTEAHTSQTSFSKGYGGKFGVQEQTDKVRLMTS